MAYDVRISREALEDLRRIYKIIEADSSLAAEEWFLGLEAAIFSLEELPGRTPKTPETPDAHHLLYGNKPHVYRIIYTIRQDSPVVEVAQIRHGARRPFRPLKR